MTITRREFTEVLKDKTQFSPTECGQIVDELFETIAESLERGENVKISGFGSFQVREKRARKGRNPQTGQQMEISARRVVTFKPSYLLKKKLGTLDKEPHMNSES